MQYRPWPPHIRKALDEVIQITEEALPRETFQDDLGQNASFSKLSLSCPRRIIPYSESKRHNEPADSDSRQLNLSFHNRMDEQRLVDWNPRQTRDPVQDADFPRKTVGMSPPHTRRRTRDDLEEISR